jgi:hypothetical protein
MLVASGLAGRVDVAGDVVATQHDARIGRLHASVIISAGDAVDIGMRVSACLDHHQSTIGGSVFYLDRGLSLRGSAQAREHVHS